MENRPADATRSYVGAIRLGIETSRGGLIMDRLVGIACEGVGSIRLVELLPKLRREAEAWPPARVLISGCSSAKLSTAMTTTVDQKGSVALPAEVLRDSDVHPGDELDVSAEDGSIILRRVTHMPPAGLLDILRGLKGLPIPERSRSSVRDVQL